MNQLVEFETAGGTAVVFEVEEDFAGEIPAGNRAGEVATKAVDALEDALDGLEPAARAVFDKLKGLAPDEIEIELGIKLTAEAGVVISKVGGEANIGIKLTWKRGQAGY